MNQIPTQININDWYEFGGGFTATSFYHNTDTSVMMKLYAAFMNPKDPLEELELSERVLELGLDVAKPIAYVTTGDGRYGAVFERFVNKRSISRILSEEPQRLDEMAKIFAAEAKKLHSTPCDTSMFENGAERMKRSILAAENINSEIKKKAAALIESVPPKTTCLHGDFHLGNMLIVDGKPKFIDLGDFSYGNPLFDLGQQYFNCADGTEGPCEMLYHISLDMMRRFWDKFALYYFDDTENIASMLRPFIGLSAAWYLSKINKPSAILSGVAEQYL